LFEPLDDSVRVDKTCDDDSSKITPLPEGLTIKDLKDIRDYFGEHDKTVFEHRAYFTINSLISHVGGQETNKPMETVFKAILNK
jgi:hypothetical protein